MKTTRTHGLDEREMEPKVIEKRQTRTDEIEQKIMAMYAKGMSQRGIEDTLRGCHVWLSFQYGQFCGLNAFTRFIGQNLRII